MGKYSDHKVYMYNGIEVPSVTTILKILNKPSLIGWANYLGFKRYNVDQVLEVSANYGTFIHSIIESIIAGHHIIYSNDSDTIDDSDVYKSIKNFREWYDNNEIEPILQEHSLSTDRYAGTLDFYGLVNGSYNLVDFKTSKEIRLSMFIQLGLYIVLLEKHGYRVDKCGVVLANTKAPKHKFIDRANMNKFIELGLKLVELFHINYDLEKNWKSL